MNENGKKPILCLDFDGVLNSYTSGWKGADVIPDPPVEGMWEFLDRAVEIFEVHVFSTRTHQDGGKQAMFNWFLKWASTDRQQGVAAMLIFPKEKPPALVSLDDRCLLFTGTWPDPDELRRFQPWNKKVPAAVV